MKRVPLVLYTVGLTFAVLAQVATATDLADLIRAASMPLLGAAIALEIRREP